MTQPIAPALPSSQTMAARLLGAGVDGRGAIAVDGFAPILAAVGGGAGRRSLPTPVNSGAGMTADGVAVGEQAVPTVLVQTTPGAGASVAAGGEGVLGVAGKAITPGASKSDVRTDRGGRVGGGDGPDDGSALPESGVEAALLLQSQATPAAMIAIPLPPATTAGAVTAAGDVATATGAPPTAFVSPATPGFVSSPATPGFVSSPAIPGTAPARTLPQPAAGSTHPDAFGNAGDHASGDEANGVGKTSASGGVERAAGRVPTPSPIAASTPATKAFDPAPVQASGPVPAPTTNATVATMAAAQTSGSVSAQASGPVPAPTTNAAVSATAAMARTPAQVPPAASLPDAGAQVFSVATPNINPAKQNATAQTGEDGSAVAAVPAATAGVARMVRSGQAKSAGEKTGSQASAQTSTKSGAPTSAGSSPPLIRTEKEAVSAGATPGNTAAEDKAADLDADAVALFTAFGRSLGAGRASGTVGDAGRPLPGGSGDVTVAGASSESGYAGGLQPLVLLSTPVDALPDAGARAVPGLEPAPVPAGGGVDQSTKPSQGQVPSAGRGERATGKVSPPLAAGTAEQPRGPQAQAIEQPSPQAGAEARADATQAGQPAAPPTQISDSSAAGGDKVAGKTVTVHAVPLDQVAVHVTRAAKAGVDRIDIGLMPDNLGRIDIRLDVNRDGHVHALVIADNRETLGLLSADARALQQALQDAGLKADGGSLQFSLRGEHGGAGQGSGGTGHARQQHAATADTRSTGEEGWTTGQSEAGHRRRHDGRVDLLA